MVQNIYDNEAFYSRYTALRNNELSYNEILEMPVMQELLPDINNKSVLDAGCGMGKFIQYLLSKNPKIITGIDISNKMIEYAKQHVNDDRVTFEVGDILTYQTNEPFNCIVSSLAFHYVEDYVGLIKKLNELLVEDGVLLFSTEHPIQTATKSKDPWIHDQSPYQHYKMDHYFEESVRETEWLGESVIRYHRTIGTMINTLIENGFVIEKVVDHGNTELSMEMWDEETRLKVNHKPPFITIMARKDRI